MPYGTAKKIKKEGISPQILCPGLIFPRFSSYVSGLSRKQIKAVLKYHFPPKKKIETKCILWEPDETNIKLLTAYRK